MLVEIDRFVNWLRRRNATARTWRDYGYDLKQFIEVVGDQPPAAIAFHDVDHFVMQQAAQGFSPATINRRLATVQSLYAFLSDEDPLLICPVLPHHGADARRAPSADETLPHTVSCASRSLLFCVSRFWCTFNLV